MLMWGGLALLLLLLGFGSVAFITLLERKLLGLSQERLGPNKVSYSGLLQPVMDGVKLLMKEFFLVSNSQTLFFILSPLLLLCMFSGLWMWVMPWEAFFLSTKMSALLFFSFLGIGAYSVIMTGWSSLSAFSKLGSLRGMLQSLSFEVTLIFMFFVLMTQSKTFSLTPKVSAVLLESYFTWIFFWLLICLMETNRAPFDLLEGESELISGFNIEFGSLPFVFLFLSEYGMILLMSLISCFILLKEISVFVLFIFSFLLFMRSCFPRVRYDIMMALMWKSVLPLSVFMFLLFFLFVYCMNNFL